jgi:hypothetical protein
MTLIKIPENNLTGVAKDKNPYWEERGITPNEARDLDSRYQRALKGFARHNKLTGPHRFFEVRIVRNRPAVDVLTQNWWEHPKFMDRVYWMFQRPMIIYLEDYSAYQLYVLEPMECLRVLNIFRRDFGNNPLGDPRTAFVVPVECCQLAWTETKGGYSEHIHYRPKIAPTQQQIDAEEEKKKKIAKILDGAIDISKVITSAEQDKIISGRG